MKKILLLFLCGFSWIIQGISNLTPRAQKKNMTTSVIIPCVARHFVWMSGILEAYQNQTVIPNEIVLVFSEAEKINDVDIAKLEKGLWDFNLKIIKRNGVFLEGENRNVAMDNASGDILIFSDADDIPHPQRVEIVKYIFDNYEVEHIIHALTFKRNELQSIDINNIGPLRFSALRDVWNYSSKSQLPLTFGSPCFLKEVGARVKWHAKEDVAFNSKVYGIFKNRIVVPEKLILYRHHLSSHSRSAITDRLKNRCKYLQTIGVGSLDISDEFVAEYISEDSMYSQEALKELLEKYEIIL